MHLTEQELNRPVIMPFEEDRATIARVASFFTCLASVWFASPQGFFGLDETPWSLNNYLAGGVMLTVALIRLIFPRETTPLGWINVVLGAWTILSPFVLGFNDHLALTVSTIGCGAVVMVLSFVSRLNSSRLIPGRSLASDNDAY